MKNLTWQNPEQLFVAQELINKVKSKCCGIKDELFRILPERVEILNGLLGADFVAFHIHDYMRHFISATERVLHKNFNLDEVQMNDRVTRVDALPMGINYDLYHNVIADDKVHHAIHS